MTRICALALALVLAALGALRDDEWPACGRDPGGQRFRPLKQINRRNVGSLKVVWTYLYLSTPLGHFVALDPVNGKVRWRLRSRPANRPGVF
jgi:quinoprotein glucose dehydrogenase